MSQTILVSSARSGTNYLLDVYQKCFPSDIVLKEIFRRSGDSISTLQEILSLPEEEILRLKDEDPAQLWRLLEKPSETKGVSLIAKIFYYHKLENDPLWEHFRSTSTVIHLIRGNIFNCYISQQLAQATGQWQLRSNKQAYVEMPTFVVNRDDYIKFANERSKQIVWVREKFEKDTYHEIFYEDIGSSPDTCAKALGSIYDKDFGDLSLKVGIQKQKKRANSEIVLNYSEVADLDCRVH